MADRAYLEKLTKNLAYEGKLIESGWIGLRLLIIPLNASPAQLNDMRIAYFAGAQHLFSSLMTFLEAGEEPTDNDMRRISLVNEELDKFANEMELLNKRTKGNA